MDATEFTDELYLIIQENFDSRELRSIQTFEDVGMLTRDAGLVVTLEDGSEFQITVVQSRMARG